MAARQQNPELQDAMIESIQQAYYLQARNPSDDDVLVDLAVGLNLDKNRFWYDLNAPDTQQRLLHEIQQAQRIGAHGFPSLILGDEGDFQTIPVDYNHPAAIIKRIADRLK